MKSSRIHEVGSDALAFDPEMIIISRICVSNLFRNEVFAHPASEFSALGFMVAGPYEIIDMGRD